MIKTMDHQPFEPQMMLIPAGEFLMGSDPEQDEQAQSNEQPQHTLYLPDYYMAKTPVTQAQYAVFLLTTGHEPPEAWGGQIPPPGRREYPAEWVSWQDAVRYCRWLADLTDRLYRLPTEAEWEKGARGSDGRVYPWGDEWQPRQCNNAEAGEGDIGPVGAYAGDVSPYGLVDMAGNVREWCSTQVEANLLAFNIQFKAYPFDVEEDEWSAPYLEEKSYRMVRGGSFDSEGDRARCAFRSRANSESYRARGLGFRVVRPG